MLEVEKFNAQQRSAAMEQAFSAAKVLYEAYLAARPRHSGGGGGSAKEPSQEEKTDSKEVKRSLAQAVAMARGQQKPNPNGPAFYASGEPETVSRVVKSDLPAFVKLRGEMNGKYSLDKLDAFRKVRLK